MLDSVCMLDKALPQQTVRYLNQVIGGEAVRVASSARTAELTYFLQETYDVFTGNVKRAPALWCKLNLEWAYRLLSQPSRIKRQWSLVEYLWLYLTGKL